MGAGIGYLSGTYCPTTMKKLATQLSKFVESSFSEFVRGAKMHQKLTQIAFIARRFQAFYDGVHGLSDCHLQRSCLGTTHQTRVPLYL